MTSIVILANTPEDVRRFLVRHLREQASMRRRQATLARIKTDQREYTRLSKNLETIASQLEMATISGFAT